MTDEPIDPLAQQVSLLDQWVEVRREINALEARAAKLLGERLTLLDEDIALFPAQRKTINRSMINEYAAGGRITKGSIEYAFEDARMLAEFPTLMEHFLAGSITAAHVRHIVRAAASIQTGIHDGSVEPAVLGLYEQAALEFAESESPTRTNAHVKELAAALAPQVVVAQNRRGEKERRIWMRSFEDGVSILHMILPTAKAVAILDRTRAIAREALAASDTANPDFRLPIDWDAEFAAWQARERAEQTGSADSYWLPSEAPGEPGREVTCVLSGDELSWGDEAWAAYEAHCDAAVAAGPDSTLIDIAADDRTLDQAQADAICDLLLGSDPTAVIGSDLENIKAQVQVTVNGSTLAGLDDLPAQLDGHGPIDPNIARQLAGENLGWSRLFMDPTGMVTCTDTYTPNAAMQRFLRARDQHCRFPGCRQPVYRCQLDHTLDYAKGGKTDIHNLAHLCVTHHAMKHPDIPERFRWKAVQRPDWTIEWTSPAQRTYIDRPPKRVMFVPSPVGADPASEGTTAPSEAPPW